jgi:hypothetical protein
MKATSPHLGFVLLRGPTDAHPRAPIGLVYRARAHGEHMWVMSMHPGAANHQRLTMLLALLTVDQALQILPPQVDSPGPGIGLLLPSGAVRAQATSPWRRRLSRRSGGSRTS